MTIGRLNQNTLFHPSEIELSTIIDLLLEKVKEINATRIVFDSVSELRLLSETSLRYRRQMLAFKDFFVDRGTTVLFLDDLTSQEAGDVHVQSVVHGVLTLEKFRAAFGAERRQFHISKLRGVDFRGGTHDYLIKKGGIVLFPRLTSATQKANYESETLSTGITGFDDLLGGGLNRGTSNLILGPAGCGKSTIALSFAVAAARRGDKVAFYSFEESTNNILLRAKALDIDLRPHIESGKILLQKIDPAELTPGQFSALVRAPSNREWDVVVMDSLNGYVHAMPEAQFLMLQLHELLAYLGHRGVVTILVLAQSGIVGVMQTPLDLTYLADTVVVTRFYEAFGRVKKAIAVIKKRTGPHEEALREFKVGQGGILVGAPLRNLRGILNGSPQNEGKETQVLDS